MDYGEFENWDSIGAPDAIKKYFMPYIPGSKFISEGNLTEYTIYTYTEESATANGGYSD